MQPLVDERETARLLKRKLQTLRNDRSMKRGLPYIKVGRSVRYSVEDIENYLQAHRVNTGEAA
jgi:Helix-turn-helix domain